MNIQEYHNRISAMHTTTGVPSYWEQLQYMIKERDIYKQIADEFAASCVVGENLVVTEVNYGEITDALNRLLFTYDCLEKQDQATDG
jgi:hypothetical protein